MKFENLTPHSLNIQLSNGEFLPPLQPSELGVARVSMETRSSEDIEGIPISIIEYGEVTGLPDPQDGVAFIVSGMVLEAVHGRDDVYAPGPLLRDEHGRPIGCQGLKTK